jgi:glyoxylase-like metal-dependent hydrolase (beta-lactamase superfamily II)
MNPRPSAKAWASKGLEYPFEPHSPGTVQEVAQGLLWVRMPLPFALDHINLWLLADGPHWTLVDCGLGSNKTRMLWDEIFARDLGGRPVGRLIVTHYHPDHIGLAGWISARLNLVPWMTKGEFLTAHAACHNVGGTGYTRVRDFFARHGLDPARLEAAGVQDGNYRSGVEPLPDTFRRIRHDDRIVIGEGAWRVIVGYGHAPEHAALHDERAGILISGDMLLPRISTNVSVWPVEPDGDPLGDFLDSIERFSELDADTLVLPSHGRPFRGIRTRIAELKAHHAMRLEALARICDRERTAAELLPALFRRDFADYQLLFAMGETIAHLNHLWHRGLLRRVAGADGVWRFARAH